MARLNITSEGYAEEAFVNRILAPHLASFGVYVTTRRLRTSKGHRGGYTSYGKAKFDITQWLKQDATAFHSTLIDLYGLKDDFPGYTESKSKRNSSDKVDLIEQRLATDINNSQKFIPYIQLHEFEALLYSDTTKMEDWLCLYNSDLAPKHFQTIRSGFNTPEDINDSPLTAPSKRILTAVPSYQKVIDGILILEDIGIAKIRSECPHFDSWLTILENLK